MEWIAVKKGGPCRVNHAAAAVDNCIYSFGGYITGLDYTDTRVPIEVYVLDIRTYIWTVVRPPPLNAPYRRYGHSVVAYKKNVYLWGGRNDEHCDGVLYCFDTVTREWSQPEVFGSIPVPSDGHACCIGGNTMFIHGGYVERALRFTLSLHALNLDTMVWTELPIKGDGPLYRDFHSMCSFADSKLIVFGGREMMTSQYSGSDQETYPHNLHVYDLHLRRWSILPQTGTVPVGRRSHSAYIFQNRMYIFGGFNSRISKHMNDIYSYNLGTEGRSGWYYHPSRKILPSPRRRQVMCLIGTVVYMFGGTHPDPYATHLNPEIFEPSEREPLRELDDMWILDMKPSLRSLCLLSVVRNKLDTSQLPTTLRMATMLIPRAEVIPATNQHPLRNLFGAEEG